MKRGRMKQLKTAVALVLALAVIAGGGYVADMLGVFSVGNYGLSEMNTVPGTPLKGKTILFLGSSVTYGYGSFGVSFVDYLSEIYGVNAVKEAVSGTTLADLKQNSYVSRLKKMDTGIKADAFVCQLSTNDATKGVPLGAVSGSFDMKDFDTATVAGATEYIIAYVKETWGCPVAFYTQAKYESDAYAAMAALLDEIGAKWDISVIDLWNDETLNAISDEERKRYLVDEIHPTKAGYRDWWLPKIQQALAELLQ